MKKLHALFALAVAGVMITSQANAQIAQSGETLPEEPVLTTPDDPGTSGPSRRPPMSVSENEVQPLKLYPNPSIGSEFTMDLPLSDEEPIALFIFDMNGRIVERQSGSYGELRHFRFRHLEEAAYIVKVFSEEVLFQSRVFVVHR